MTDTLMIPPSMVRAAEAAGACEEAIEWLRARPRSWRDLALYQLSWFLWASGAIGCPPDVLRVLAQDDDPDVRWVAASHRSTPADVLAPARAARQAGIR